MDIVHLAPYAPNGAGIYEAARDMIRADSERGHNVMFVDVGATLKNGQQVDPCVNTLDARGGYTVITRPRDWINYADLLVYHTGVNDGWVVQTQAPIVVMVHGRPAASFRPEQMGVTQRAYSLIAEFARWPRVKKLIWFWPEHTPYWRVLIPEEKCAELAYPPIDLARFTPDGERHEFGAEFRGKWNALICDSWREDIDAFEIVNGAIAAAERIPGLKVHLYAIETQPDTNLVLPCWEYLIAKLRNMGALGEVWGRQVNFERIYRGADFVMTPHRIITRTIGESLACGTPVLAAHGCTVTDWTADIFEPDEVTRVAVDLVGALKADRDGVRQASRKKAEECFSLPRYGEAIEPVYREAMAG